MSTVTAPFAPAHVGLNVSDVDRSTRFYQRVFGLDLAFRSDATGRQYAFLSRDGAIVLTLWRQSEGAFTGARPGLHHLAFQAASLAEVEAAERRLRDLGATVLHGGIVAHAEGAGSISAPSAAGAHEAPYGDAPACGFF